MSDEYEVWADVSADDSFASASLDSLKASPDVSSDGADEAFNYQQERDRAKIHKLKSENAMRSSFFGWASKLAGWVVGLNMVIFLAYMGIQAFAPGKIPDSVMLSWIAGTVVETLGIVAIVARHLFPGKKWQSKGIAPKREL